MSNYLRIKPHSFKLMSGDRLEQLYKLLLLNVFHIDLYLLEIRVDQNFFIRGVIKLHMNVVSGID